MENPSLDAAIRYKNLCKMFISLASRAADFEDSYLLVEEALHNVSKQVEEKLKELLTLMQKSLVLNKHSACQNNMLMSLV